jgi:type II restriction/modification system DNA methylase subunit YeeA
MAEKKFGVILNIFHRVHDISWVSELQINQVIKYRKLTKYSQTMHAITKHYLTKNTVLYILSKFTSLQD